MALDCSKTKLKFRGQQRKTLRPWLKSLTLEEFEAKSIELIKKGIKK